MGDTPGVPDRTKLQVLGQGAVLSFKFPQQGPTAHQHPDRQGHPNGMDAPSQVQAQVEAWDKAQEGGGQQHVPEVSHFSQALEQPIEDKGQGTDGQSQDEQVKEAVEDLQSQGVTGENLSYGPIEQQAQSHQNEADHHGIGHDVLGQGPQAPVVVCTQEPSPHAVARGGIAIDEKGKEQPKVDGDGMGPYIGVPQGGGLPNGQHQGNVQ